MKRFWFALIPAVLIIGAVAWIFMPGPAHSPTSSQSPAVSVAPSKSPAEGSQATNTPAGCSQVTEQVATITYSEGREFSPTCLVIAAGTKLVWDNKSGSSLEVGADPHPIHSGDKAISSGDFVFEVAAHSQRSETITKVGTYHYHDHAHASATGQLIVR